MRKLRLTTPASVVLLLTGTAAAVAQAPGDAAKLYDQQVRPLLEARCLKCHGAGKVRGGLRLTSRETVLEGGDSGPAVSLENPDASLLLKAINYADGLQMPPSGKLPPNEVAILTRWVRAGIPWSTDGKPAPPAAESRHARKGEEGRDYWAYQRVQRPAVPVVRERSWVRNSIDAFVLARLEAAGLRPAPPADRVALLRRLCYDLTGLPPTPHDVERVCNDPAPDWYERLVDRLLASPHYGEKWGRHWLDLVRYAETNGYERDGPKPYAWRFRDYVIRSFNADKPFDRFIREQLAGDEMPGHDPDAIIATGYYRLGLWDDEPADPKQSRYDELDDYVATTAQVFLGMTMNCARCHDHKIDPLTQTDYYRLLAFFLDIPHFSDTREVRSRFNLTDISPPEVRARYEKELQQREARIAELTAAMTRIEDEAIRKMPAEDQRAAEGIDREQVLRLKLDQFLTAEQRTVYQKLKGELKVLRNQPDPGREMALSVNHCLTHPPPAHVLIRGNPHAPGARVEPGFPAVLGFADPYLPPPKKDARSSGRRTVLANWIASPDNPLTARVLVNRLWQYHFGRGLVPTPNDFGKFGQPPTHPELLDWLADELIAGGWRLKRLHRLILTSSAYRMSSQANAEALRRDPANSLFWRFNPRRLTAEEVRDSVLAVSGRLNLKAGGPSIHPPIPKAVLAGQSVPGQGWPTSGPLEASRRSIYVHVKRSLLLPVLAQHDQADTDSTCPVRYTTTVPTQALGMLNGDFTNEQATAFAERLQREMPDDLAAQVRYALRLTTGRPPADEEVRKDVALLEELRFKFGLSGPAALRQYCLLVLNTNEFLYLD